MLPPVVHSQAFYTYSFWLLAKQNWRCRSESTWRCGCIAVNPTGRNTTCTSYLCCLNWGKT